MMSTPVLTPSARLVVSDRHLQVMTRHAAEAYPEECCGVLLGTLTREKINGSGASGEDEVMELTLAQRVLSVENERDDSRHNRFLISPETVLAAEKQARQLGLDVVGYYHSHPDHPAVPSEFDRSHAWPGMSYVIVSVEDGEPVATRSWRLVEDRTHFEEESLETGPSPGSHRAPGGKT